MLTRTPSKSPLLPARRTLSRAQARRMIAVRLARKAWVDFRTQCFWSYGETTITTDNVGWAVEQLRRNGNRNAWQAAARIERFLCH
ncbi:hypothetical protein OpiT1DRAFT_04363 [Opitutaceae bacterium TAV1]|nr:hypothetical protein OpiT1DRAFT_04363 [Opitutaceae bacterium TAV1]